MARSSYIYVVQQANGEMSLDPVAAFTVRYEMVDWIRMQIRNSHWSWANAEILRMVDGGHNAYNYRDPAEITSDVRALVEAC